VSTEKPSRCKKLAVLCKVIVDSPLCVKADPHGSENVVVLRKDKLCPPQSKTRMFSVETGYACLGVIYEV
jgi:hypothetical protein